MWARLLLESLWTLGLVLHLGEYLLLQGWNNLLWLQMKKLAEEAQPKEKKEVWNMVPRRAEITVQLQTNNHEWLESCDEFNSCMESSETNKKCIKKMHLIEKYKEAKDWKRRQTGGRVQEAVVHQLLKASMIGLRTYTHTYRHVIQGYRGYFIGPLHCTQLEGTLIRSPSGVILHQLL